MQVCKKYVYSKGAIVRCGSVSVCNLAHVEQEKFQESQTHRYKVQRAYLDCNLYPNTVGNCVELHSVQKTTLQSDKTFVGQYHGNWLYLNPELQVLFSPSDLALRLKWLSDIPQQFNTNDLNRIFSPEFTFCLTELVCLPAATAFAQLMEHPCLNTTLEEIRDRALAQNLQWCQILAFLMGKLQVFESTQILACVFLQEKLLGKCMCKYLQS